MLYLIRFEKRGGPKISHCPRVKSINSLLFFPSDLNDMKIITKKPFWQL